MDVGACRGADIVSDHALVMVMLRASTKKTGWQRHPRFDISKLAVDERRQEFAISFSNRFQAFTDLEDGSLKKKWDRVRGTLVSSCEEVMGFRRRGFKTWLSEESINKKEERQYVKQNI